MSHLPVRRWTGPLTVAGATPFIIMLASLLMMFFWSHSDSQRLALREEASVTVFMVSVWVAAAWAAVAAIVAVVKWRTTTRGFRLVLLLNGLVVTTFAAGYFHESPSVKHAKEAVLRDDLYTMRLCIDQYTIGKGKPPRGLDELVLAGYLKKIPVDPITGKADTWVLERSQDPITHGGIVGIHSGSQSISSDGTSYRHW